MQMLKKPLRIAVKCALWAAAVFAALVVLAAAHYLISCRVMLRIRHYAKTHEEFTLSEAVGDWWDVAYHDPHAYSDGTDFAEKHGLRYSGKWLRQEQYRRVFFVRKGALRHVMTFDSYHGLVLPSKTEVITPQTRFSARWRDRVLYLDVLPEQS